MMPFDTDSSSHLPPASDADPPCPEPALSPRSRPLASLPEGVLPKAALAGAVVLAATADLPAHDAQGQPVYEARTGTDNPLRDQALTGFSRPSLIDVDGDGDLDAIVTDAGDYPVGITNEGDATAASFAYGSSIDPRLYGDDHLTFADLDGDGDLDAWDSILYGPNYLISFENEGSATTLDLTLTTYDSTTDNIEGAAHGDLDGDGDFDLVLGYSESGEGRLAYYENTGTATDSVLTRRTGADNPFDGFTVGDVNPTPEIADVDGDGDLDLVVGKENGTFAYFENTGSATNPTFELRTSDSQNPFSGLSAGDRSAPALGDLDGDGDLDLVSGFFEGSQSTDYAELLYFENTGDQTRLVTFSEATDDPLSVVGLPGNASAILGDLDADGDDDAVVGQSDGSLAYFVNTGDAETPTFIEQTGAANPFSGLDAGDNSAPALGDLDGDGDLDLVVGKSNGLLAYFENTGSITSPSFTQRSGSSNPFEGFDVGTESSPALADADGDGDPDLVVGNADGFLFYYENTGDVLSPAFTRQTGSTNPLNGFDVGTNAAPRLSDLDRDGDMDAVVGRSDGTVAYFENDGTRTNADFAERTGTANPLAGVALSGESAPGFSDLDADGDPDLALGTQDGAVKTYVFGTTDVLPVELTGFSARADGNGVVLTWSTASESGNAGFEVHRMLDATSGLYDRLGFVDGAGTVQDPQTYRFRTDDLAPGTHRFRLKQVDVDGGSAYSETVAVDLRMTSAYRLKAPAPNPTPDVARMSITVDAAQSVRVAVYDVLGRRVAVPHDAAVAAQERLTLTLGETLADGTYLVRVTGETFTTTEKLVIVQ